MPCTHDERLLEYIILDGAQCGLSWRTIFERRAAYARAFRGWDIASIASMVWYLEELVRLVLWLVS